VLIFLPYVWEQRNDVVVSDRDLFERRRRVADALQLSDEVLLVGAGEPVPLPEYHLLQR